MMIKSSFVYLIVRWGIGISFFGHGLVRLPKLTAFSNWMVTLFENSALPKAIVLPYSYVLPVIEFAIGLLLLLGLFTRYALAVGAFVVLSLLFGSCLLENWDALTSQFIHLAFVVTLLNNSVIADRYSLDAMLFRR